MGQSVEMPFINVRDLVIYPKMQIPLMVGRKFTIDAIDFAKKKNKGRLLAITQKFAEDEDPKKKSDMYSVGMECKIVKSVTFPNDTMKVLIEGIRPVKVSKIIEKDDIRFVQGEVLPTPSKGQKMTDDNKRELLELLLKWNPKIALDQESTVLSDLSKEKNSNKFMSRFLRLICYVQLGLDKHHRAQLPKNQKPLSKGKNKSINLGISKRQKLLEETNLKKQITLAKNMLREEAIAHLQR